MLGLYVDVRNVDNAIIAMLDAMDNPINERVNISISILKTYLHIKDIIHAIMMENIIDKTGKSKSFTKSHSENRL